jgi:3',5'-cyclic AMP phosphodiesterase CpdA
MTRVVQLSDTHIKPGGRLAYRKVDTAAALARAVAHINALAETVGEIDAVVMSGDLTDTGTAAEYAMFRDLTADLAAPLLVLPGNHDLGAAMRVAFPDQPYAQAHGPLDFACDVGALRIVALDSTVPGAPHGALGSDQIAWLDGELAASRGRPTLVFLHHPPFDTGIRHMDVQRLLDAGPFLDCATGREHVLLVGCGHVHRSISTMHRGTPIHIAPSPAHAVALDHRPDGPSAFRVEPGAVLLHAWSPLAGVAAGRLVTSVSYIGDHDGPHPFFDASGALVD